MQGCVLPVPVSTHTDNVSSPREQPWEGWALVRPYSFWNPFLTSHLVLGIFAACLGLPRGRVRRHHSAPILGSCLVGMSKSSSPVKAQYAIHTLVAKELA